MRYKLVSLRNDLEVQVTPLMIQDIHTKLSLKYTRLKCQDMEQSETNQALAVFCKFKGKCTNCGKFGHKLNECHSKTGNSKGEGVETKKAKSKMGTNKSMIKCFSCGEMGHYKSK